MNPAGPGDPVAGCGTRSLVLVAATDPSLRAAVACLLRSAGVTVVEAGDGAAAVAACRAGPGEFAAVLTDVRMPGLDGPDALSAIREVDPHVRRFLMSGDPGAYDLAELERAGAEAVFARPFDLPVLVRVITDALGRHAL